MPKTVLNGYWYQASVTRCKRFVCAYRMLARRDDERKRIEADLKELAFSSKAQSERVAELEEQLVSCMHVSRMSHACN
eukprot:352800-Chlamydomonas_euryale.AAC.17